MMRKLNPRNDFIFKKIFGEPGRERELMAFLNAILHNTLSAPITSILIIEHKELSQQLFDDKLGIIDIRATLEDATIINIEVQLINQYNMEKRTLFYWSKLYSSSIKKGENYKLLPRVITINILDFNFLGTKSYHSTFHLWEDTEKDYKLTDILELHFIEYPKFKNQVGENYKQLSKTRWLKGLEQNIDQTTLEELINLEPAMEYVQKTLDYIGSDPEMISLYEAREKARLDNINMIDSAIEEGKIEGIKEGIKKGKIEGIKEGKIEGIKEGIKKGKIEGIKEGKIEGIKEGKIEGIKEGKIEGIKEGKIEGIKEGQVNLIIGLLDILDDETLALKSDLSIEEIKDIRKKFS
ncbi:hypothetical protein AN641_02645 [Candidatus Epulonipiscioides gigas]|nr:hypothetical protein AN641_02645 [Epulopiscium sp. SCG-C07WGA-EpuloA2]